jgi:hypothetical protein
VSLVSHCLRNQHHNRQDGFAKPAMRKQHIEPAQPLKYFFLMGPKFVTDVLPVSQCECGYHP